MTGTESSSIFSVIRKNYISYYRRYRTMKNYILDHVAETICAIAAISAVGLAVIVVSLVKKVDR